MFTDFVGHSNPEDTIDQCQIYSEINFTSIQTPQIGILMTPACDMAQGKVDFYNFCAVIPLEEIIFAFIKKKYSLDKDQFKGTTISEKKEGEIKEKINQIIGNQIIRYYWLGNIPGKLKYWCIDFQIIQSFKESEMNTIKNSKFAVLPTPYKESAYVNFANYLGRVGLQGETPARKSLASSIYSSMKAEV